MLALAAQSSCDFKGVNNEDDADNIAGGSGEQTETAEHVTVEDSTKDCTEDTSGRIKGEHSSHCHCNLFEVDDDLTAFMSEGKPYRTFKADVNEKKTELENEKIRQHMKKDNDNRVKNDLKVEMNRLRRKLKEDLKEKMRKGKPKPQTDVEKKEQRAKRKLELQDQREAKRKQIFLAFD